MQLGALLELGEKIVIVGELGKLLLDEIPVMPTEPGVPRAYYDGKCQNSQPYSGGTKIHFNANFQVTIKRMS